MSRYYTKTFVSFLFAFLGIVAIGFAVAMLASHSGTASSVDNVAAPQ